MASTSNPSVVDEAGSSGERAQGRLCLELRSLAPQAVTPSAHQQPPSLMGAQCSVYLTVQSPRHLHHHLPAASMESCTDQVKEYLQTRTVFPGKPLSQSEAEPKTPGNSSQTYSQCQPGV